VRWAVFDAQAQYFVHLGCTPSSDRRPFFMHRRSASCIWGAFVNCAFPVRWFFLMHRRTTSCILGCLRAFGLLTFFQPRPLFHAQAQCFVHLGCFCYCAFPVRWVSFDAQAQYFVHSGLSTLSNNYLTADYLLCTGVALHVL
jgi:hypothetical protein